MDIKIRCCELGARASDNSIIEFGAVRDYLESEEYKISVQNRTMLGYLTHRARGVNGMPSSGGDANVLLKKIGSDDQGYIVADGVACFTHYVKRFYIEETPTGNYLSAEVHILNPDDFDQRAAENIKRLRGLIISGVRCNCSLVITAYWSGDKNTGADYCKKIKNIKGIDFTQNPSFGIKTHITEVIYDDDEKEKLKDRTFSNINENTDDGIIKVKTFSNPTEAGVDISNSPKTSKIDGQFTYLKVKEFSFYSDIKAEEDESNLVEKKFTEQPQSEENKKEQPEQKEFTQAGIRDQLREKKMSPRMCFRRMIISYKQVVRSMGGVEKIKPEDLSILKSMLTSDVLFLLNRISNDVISNNKRINVLLGCSSISKNLRQSAEKLNMIYRLSGIQAKKTGFLQKTYYTKLQTAWNEFVGSCIEEVFGANSNNIPEENVEEEIKEEK